MRCLGVSGAGAAHSNCTTGARDKKGWILGTAFDFSSKFEAHHADIIRYHYPREWDRMLLPGLSEVTFATAWVKDWGCFRNTRGVRRCTTYLSEVYLSVALLFEPEATEVLKAKQVGKLGKWWKVTFADIGFRSNSLYSRCLSTVVLSWHKVWQCSLIQYSTSVYGLNIDNMIKYDWIKWWITANDKWINSHIHSHFGRNRHRSNYRTIYLQFSGIM